MFQKPSVPGYILSLVTLTLIACGSELDQSSAVPATTVKGPSCSIETLRALPDVRIISVTEESAPVLHCKVAGVIGTETHFELLLPETWNGKFAMGGGGGFVGSVMNTSLMFGSLQAGYATVGTDTGHQGHPLDASWALNNLERLVSFGHQAVHRTAVTAKALIKDYYGAEIARSYFTGCSRGGSQALMEAQRYPEDFDGIVAGAPAHNWTGLAALATQITKAMYPDPEDLRKAVVGPEEKELIQSSYLAMCDAQDGITDGILNDPRECEFDVASLLCDA
jgi:feruloyl esterase